MESYNLILGSGDLNASGTASDFTIYSVDLSLDPEGQYVCALIDASFPNPVITTTAPKSCFIQVDFIEYQIVGSNKFQLLYKTAPITVSSTTNPLYYEKEVGNLIPWRAVENKHIFNIRVQITASDGSAIPNTNFSIIQLVIKRVA